MKTYLIQRAKFENSQRKGIDSIISLDYMGSSEFEFGAIPESLGSIRKAINEYTYLDVPIKDKIITVFCKESQKSEVKTYLVELATNNMMLKEYSDFDNYIKPSSLNNRTDFWWDLENHLMFWKKNEEFETKFKVVIPNKPFGDIDAYEKEIGMTDLKEEQLEIRRNSHGKKGKYWLALSPRWIENEETKSKTKYKITYWVNYGDDNTYGHFTVEQIKQWLTTPDLQLSTLGGTKER